MTKILAIDVGTASLSAVVAEKNANEKFFVCDVLRYPYDIFDSKNASRILLKNLEQVFFEISKFHPDTERVAIGFSFPLHLEKIVSTESIRPNPEFPISEEELNRTIQILKNQIKNGLKSISHNMLETKINGYSVENPLGHKGEVLEIKANLLMLAPFLKNRLDELRDKFFPSSEFNFFSDSTILKKTISRLFSPKGTFTILNIGEAVSTLGDLIFSFGVRAIEKKIDPPAGFLPRFSSGNLDYVHERVVNKILKSSAEIFRDALKERKSDTIFLTGTGANFLQFFDIAKENSVAEVKTFEAQDFNKIFLKLSPLSGGEDAVLTALISITQYA